MPEQTDWKPGQMSQSHLLTLMKAYGRMLQSDVDRIMLAASTPSDRNMIMVARRLKAIRSGSKDLQTLLNDFTERGNTAPRSHRVRTYPRTNGGEREGASEPGEWEQLRAEFTANVTET